MNLSERDRAILLHLGRYRFSIRAVLEKAFFDGRSSDNVLQRLSKNRKIQTRSKALPGQLSYYQLTPAEAKRLGFPEERAEPPGSQACPEHLAILWFCYMGPVIRHRLELDELQGVLPGIRHRRAHCVEDGARPSLYRVYVPGSLSDDLTLVRTLREDIDEILSHPDWRKGLKAKRYRVAVLGQTRTRTNSLQELIGKSDLASCADFLYEVAPGPEDLKESIDGLTK